MSPLFRSGYIESPRTYNAPSHGGRSGICKWLTGTCRVVPSKRATSPAVASSSYSGTLCIPIVRSVRRENCSLMAGMANCRSSARCISPLPVSSHSADMFAFAHTFSRTSYDGFPFRVPTTFSTTVADMPTLCANARLFPLYKEFLQIGRLYSSFQNYSQKRKLFAFYFEYSHLRIIFASS